MSTIHINIGSNIGDRAALIERAVAALCERIDSDCRAEIRLAPIIETEPWGYESDNRFLNLGLMIKTDREEAPLEVLGHLQAVEKEIGSTVHRGADGRYLDRAIDLDLIAVDYKVSDEPGLQLPHPRMHLRDFVLTPVARLDPEWRHPLTGQTAAEMLDAL